mmetsp:Transcript_115941/g.328109  ORF Transcript_115941/g.328109 Transcript_115941/m.328109 type:complete len:489 (+) Transcript_115941:80-1546(+)
MRGQDEDRGSLFLASGGGLGLLLARHDLAQHHHAIAVHESDAREALAVLEGVANERLLRLEGALGHLVGLQRMWLLHFLAARLLAHLPDELRDAARRAAATHEADGRVTHLDFVRDVQDLDLGVEFLRLPQRGVLLVYHDVARARHVVLVQALDVEADVVAGVREVHALVVHLHGEDLAGARVGGGVRGQENDLLTGLHDALLHAAREDVAHALDLVDARDWHAHRRTHRALRHTAELVQHVVERVHVELLAANEDVHALPPRHLVRFLQKVVAHPAGDGQDGRVFLDEVFLPPHLDQHALHLVRDLVVAVLLVASGVTIHFVHADADLLHAQQIDKPRVLPRLALDLSSLVVAPGDRRRKIAVGRHHDERDVRLRCARDHVLDEITVPGGVDDGVVPLRGEEFLRRASDGHTTLALLLLPIHVEGEGEGALAQTLSLRLQLFQLALWNAAELEEQPARRCALAAIDVAADHDREVLLLGRHGECTMV